MATYQDMTTYQVVADDRDKKGLERKRPVFEFEDREYFHGDEFVPPELFKVDEDYEGRGVKFQYLKKFTPTDEAGNPLLDEEGRRIVKEVERRTILPLIAVSGETKAEEPKRRKATKDEH